MELLIFKELPYSFYFIHITKSLLLQLKLAVSDILDWSQQYKFHFHNNDNKLR